MSLHSLLVRASLDQSEFDTGLNKMKANAAKFAKDLEQQTNVLQYGKDQARLMSYRQAGLDQQTLDSLKAQISLRDQLKKMRDEESRGARDDAVLGGGLRENIRALKAGGLLMALNFVTRELGQAAEAAARMQEEIARGKANAADLALAMMKTAPIIGGAAQAGESINEFITGWGKIRGLAEESDKSIAIVANTIRNTTSAQDELNKASAFGNQARIEAIEHARALKQIEDNAKSAQQELGKLGIDTYQRSLQVDEEAAKQALLANETLAAQQLSRMWQEEQKIADAKQKTWDEEAKRDQALHEQHMQWIADEADAERQRATDLEVDALTRIYQAGLTPADRINQQLDEAKNALDRGLITSEEFDRFGRSFLDKSTDNSSQGYRGVGAATYGSQDAYSAIARAQAPTEKKLDKIAENTKAVADWLKKNPDVRLVGRGPKT
jgi:hypothetical protein